MTQFVERLDDVTYRITRGKKINWVVQQTYNLLREFNIDS